MTPKICETCKYSLQRLNEQPCCKCISTDGKVADCWEPKEEQRLNTNR